MEFGQPELFFVPVSISSLFFIFISIFNNKFYCEAIKEPFTVYVSVNCFYFVCKLLMIKR